MKKLVFVILLIGVISTCGCIGEEKTTIKVSGAFALYPMMGIWAEQYEYLNPDVKIDISKYGF